MKPPRQQNSDMMEDEVLKTDDSELKNKLDGLLFGATIAEHKHEQAMRRTDFRLKCHHRLIILHEILSDV